MTFEWTHHYTFYVLLADREGEHTVEHWVDAESATEAVQKAKDFHGAGWYLRKIRLVAAR